MNNFLQEKDLKPIIILAIKEDLGQGDITTNAIFGNKNFSSAVIVAKEKGIFCEGGIIRLIYNKIDASVKTSILKKDGQEIKKGEEVALITGKTGSILTGERVCMNFIQRMSGIASSTKKMVSILEHTEIQVLDTRKTAPGLRLLDKYSVKCGGGENHRIGLFDLIMIKDNHIKAAGSITNAVKCVREKYGSKYKIEIEAVTSEDAAEAAALNVDIIMLDNMNKKSMEEAIKIINSRAKIEISGNMDEKKILSLLDMKVDFVSILTG